MTTKTQVLIAGAGPVGMTLALELARYGIKSILVERNQHTTKHPKMDYTNGRSMELFRRLGMVDNLREAGVAPDNPFVIGWITSFTGHQVYRFTYPSSNAKRVEISNQNDGTQASEPPLRVSQVAIEPVLKKAVDENGAVDVRFGTSFERIVEQHADKVIAEIKTPSGQIETIECQYLAGCDGGGSRVRRNLGIELEGELDVAGAYMVHFHSTDTDLLQRWGVIWHAQTGSGTLIAQNDIDTWTLQAWLPPGDEGTTWKAEEVLESWVGRPFQYEILQANPWKAHFVVAERYIDNRVALAGDAAHQFIPTGGYGMNSGIADAAALGWVLAAQVQGWGGPRLFEAYDAERRPTAWQHLNASKRHMGVRIEIGGLYQEAGSIEGDDSASAAKREQLGEQIKALGNAENESWGVEMGYRYTSSPIVFSESDVPPCDPLNYQPTTYPGGRLPHLFLKDGTRIHDLLGKYFTLLVIGEGSAEVDLADGSPIPLDVVQVDDAKVSAIYKTKYLLVRPDQHIAWRGDVLPADFGAILKGAAGW